VCYEKALEVFELVEDVDKVAKVRGTSRCTVYLLQG
jgi:hypothetical protein